MLMKERVPVQQFMFPEKNFSNLSAAHSALLIAASTDVALIIDGKGVIRDVAFSNEEIFEEGFRDWVGMPWSDTVTVESRPKVEALLRMASEGGEPRWRHVNYPSRRGPDLPVLYSTIALPGAEDDGWRAVAFGRDLRDVAALQQRLLDAQQSLERDYWRLRQMETRYRLLFQLASEAMVMLDVATQRVVEANPAAIDLLGESERRLVGAIFPEGFEERGTGLINAALASARVTGRGEEVRARHEASGRELTISAALVRADPSALLLVRLAPREATPFKRPARSALVTAIENAPDGFVVTDFNGRLVAANRAFLDMVQVASEDQARGETLERWLGRSGVDFGVLLANLRQHGSIRLFATRLKGEYGSLTEIEISAVAVEQDDAPCIGFAIRNVDRRLSAEPRETRELPRSVEQLTELVGRVPLKDLVREATDLIERLCIEAALDLTKDNRASAAEMLGLSRQSFYVKLRRYGLGDLDGESGGKGEA